MNLILFSLWRTILPFATTLNAEGGNSIIWFVVLYLTGAYLAKYPVDISKSKLIISLVSLLGIAFISYYELNMLSNRFGFGGKGSSILIEFTSFPIYGSAICALLMAVKISDRIKGTFIRKLIVVLSSSTLGVYLIHENPFVRKWLWTKLNLSAIPNWIVIPSLFLYAIVIFIICVIIDKLTWQLLLKGINRIHQRSSHYH